MKLKDLSLELLESESFFLIAGSNGAARFIIENMARSELIYSIEFAKNILLKEVYEENKSQKDQSKDLAQEGYIKTNACATGAADGKDCV